MASSTKYTWRVNRTPRFTVLDIGEYMVVDDGPRETMRRNMKFERIAPTILYRKVQTAVARFLASPTRDRRIIAACRADLEAERETAVHPKVKENATYAIRSLDAFERSINAIPMSGVQFAAAPIYPKPLVIEGVKVSVQPTTLITVARPRGKNLKGAILVDTAKGTEPRTDAAKEDATKAMTHSAYLLHERIAGQIVGDDERASPEHCMVFHAYRQQLVCSPTSYRRDMRNLEAACRDIAKAWDAIEPPASFDRTLARFRD